MTGPQPRSPLGTVFFTVFLDLIGFGILIPIQPFYAESFGARPAVVTMLSASFSLVQFLFAPLLGRLSDRIGRRPVMLTTIALNALGYLLFGLASSLTMLFLARLTSGLGSANIGTAQAIVADSTTPETRARGMGIVGMAFGLGFIFGPAIGGVFGQWGLSAPAFLAASLSTLNLAIAWFRLPETLPAEGRASARALPHRMRVGLSVPALTDAVRHDNVMQLFWLYFVGTMAFSLMEQVLGLFIERTWVQDAASVDHLTHLRRASLLTTYVLIVVGVTSAVVQGGLVGRLAKLFGERRLVQAGGALITIGLAAIPMAGATGRFPLMLAVGAVLAVGSGLTSPSLPSLLSQSVGRDAYGGILGLGQSLSALGRVVGPTMAGALFEWSHIGPFIVGAALSATCVAVSMTLKR
jgi:multidrug resistance protein